MFTNQSIACFSGKKLRTNEGHVPRQKIRDVSTEIQMQGTLSFLSILRLKNCSCSLIWKQAFVKCQLSNAQIEKVNYWITKFLPLQTRDKGNRISHEKVHQKNWICAMHFSNNNSTTWTNLRILLELGFWRNLINNCHEIIYVMENCTTRYWTNEWINAFPLCPEQ